MVKRSTKERGDFPGETKRVTLADVARSAGVSQTAASFVLSGRREEMRISADVEARVLRAAARGRLPAQHRLAQPPHRDDPDDRVHLGHGRDHTVRRPLIWGALDAARERDHLLFIGETEGDAELERELIEAMHDRRVDGIVLASMYTRKVTVPEGSPNGPAVLLNALPTQALCRSPRSFRTRAEAGRAAARVLLDAGHTRRDLSDRRRAQTNRVPKDSLAAVQRLQGIKEAFHAAGVELAGAVPCTDWQPELGYRQRGSSSRRPRRPR